MPSRVSAGGAFLAAIAVALPASGQSAALQERLAKATRLSCAFSTVATGTWKDGAAATAAAAARLKVAFTEINVDDGTADAEGSFGGSLVAVRQTGEYLHLMQMHSAGPLYTTTVFARETPSGRFLAVHTRHEYTTVSLPGYTSRPEMYLGDCALDG